MYEYVLFLTHLLWASFRSTSLTTTNALFCPVRSKTFQSDEMRCWYHIIRHLNEMRWDVGITSFDIVLFHTYTPKVLLNIVCHVSLVDFRLGSYQLRGESTSHLFRVGQCLLLGRITIFDIWLVLSLFIFSTFFYNMLSLSLSHERMF